MTLYHLCFRVLLPVRYERQTVGEQIAPRLFCRQIAPRQRNGWQTAQPFAVAIVHPQALAAPQRAVLAHADPVQGQGNNIPAVERPAILRQTRCCMRMMMQHGLNGQRLRPGPQSGVITRMGIAHHALRLKGVDVLHRRERTAPLRLYPLVAQIAKMLAQHRLVATHQAEGVFHLRAGA